MVRVDVIHRVMERLTTTNVLFLDACRDSPLTRNLARAMGTRSAEVGKGLAAVESGIGTLISFSTQPGNVALDGTGRNSPFAGALVKHVSSSNDDLSAILIAVRNDVMKETQRKQVPWEHSSLTGRFYFNPAAQTATPGAAPGPQTSLQPGTLTTTGDPQVPPSRLAPQLQAARPQRHPIIQAGGLFTEKHAEQIQSLAEKHSIPLPDFQIVLPDKEVPPRLRRFIGVWLDETGFQGTGRKQMIDSHPRGQGRKYRRLLAL